LRCNIDSINGWIIISTGECLIDELGSSLLLEASALLKIGFLRLSVVVRPQPPDVHVLEAEACCRPIA
jgi:hypothetical protein